MKKSVLAALSLALFSNLYSSQQLVVVISEELNSSAATLQRYEYAGIWKKTAEPVSVILGRSGLGWSERSGHAGPLKYEGDGRSPAGVFDLPMSFGEEAKPNSALPYLHATEKVICVDDADDPHYNQMAVLDPEHPPKSYEKMLRDDKVYRNGIVVDYNPLGIPGRGSCIFIHLNHPDNHPTSGCTAMDESDLSKLLGWLDPSKNPKLLQIPKSECNRYQEEFPGIECR